MPNRSPQEHDPERLTQSAAERLLTRASDLDAARGAGSDVHALRSAAAEAGISMPAFDAALAELREADKAPLLEVRAQLRRRARFWGLAVAGMFVFALGAVFFLWVARRAPAGVSVGPPEGAPVVEESILLGCLSPGEAAEMVRPLLTLPSNTIVISPERAPRVLTLTATPTQLEEVKAMLSKVEDPASQACATRPTPQPTP